MAQINITLNLEEILQLLTENREEALRKLMQESLNEILQVESKEQLKAEKYERNQERTDSRNGSRERTLKTRIGTIELKVPRHRNIPFRTMLFDNYQRSDAALVATMAEMVVSGVSTRKVAKVVETLCGTTYSKSAVSEVCKELDQTVKTFKQRPLEDLYPFVLMDATYFRVRENHRITSKAFMVAYATNINGKREVVGFDVYDSETKDSWYEFMTTLRDRGLKGIKMITSDAHPGILYAISRIFPNAAWQRCQTHFSRDILEKTPAKYRAGLQSELLDMYHSKTIREARVLRDEIICDYEDIAPGAMECLDRGFEDAMTVMALPENIRRFYRTSNHIERVNRELKRRSKVIGVFPDAVSVNRLMGSLLIEMHDKQLMLKANGYPKETLKELDACDPALIQIANEQRKLFIA